MGQRFFDDRQLADIAVERLKVFAQPQRLMILSALLESECSVGDIERVTGIGQPALSQQLAVLRRAGMVETRREGNYIYYDLADEHIRLCIGCMQAMLGGSENPVASLEDAIERAAA
jgi:DNA-binding transcriptional ArsR family regulator